MMIDKEELQIVIHYNNSLCKIILSAKDEEMHLIKSTLDILEGKSIDFSKNDVRLNYDTDDHKNTIDIKLLKIYLDENNDAKFLGITKDMESLEDDIPIEYADYIMNRMLHILYSEIYEY